MNQHNNNQLSPEDRFFSWVLEKCNLDTSRQMIDHVRLYTLSSFIAVVFIAVAVIFQIPDNFPVNAVIEVQEGKNAQEIAEDMERQQIVHSSTALTLLLKLYGREEGVVAGEYYFQEQGSVFAIADRLTSGEYGLVPHSVTIPEGATVVDIAHILEDKLNAQTFDADKFIRLALPLEGYLFPDTYSFLPNTEEEEIIETMKNNFAAKIKSIEDEIDEFERPLGEVVIMASLLEKEARTSKSRRMIAGILWKRLDIGMRLQVDAVFPYINGKNTFELTRADLREDSPYNTYRYEGLPIGPIANPGLDSIKAAVNPQKNNYLFYLSDMQGNMHYAQDFEEHKRNKRRYLN